MKAEPPQDISHFIAVDIGNTHVVIGVFSNGALQRTWRLPSDAATTDDALRLQLRLLLAEAAIAPETITGAMICSVIPRLARTIESALKPILPVPPLLLTHETHLGIHNHYHHPENVGPDRLANAVGGVARHGAPLLVVDFGTATTIDAITRDREYLGGTILPGLEMSADALYQKTSLLPRIALEAPAHIIGRSTLESIASGIVRGSAAAVDRLIELAREEMGEPDCVAVATGGLAVTLAAFCPNIARVDPELTLYGILKAWERNV